MGIPILIDEELAAIGIIEQIEWHPEQAPHGVVFGATGSGKTYFCKLFLGKIIIYEKTSQIFVCDFKGDNDFSFLCECQRFYRFNECANGLQQFYEKLKARQSGEDTSRNMIVLLFDEWAAYCNSISDRKILEEEKRKLATILMLGRSFSIFLIISQQRLDANYFHSARDNFCLSIGLGNLPEESKNMLFHEFKKDMLPNRRQGTGYMLTNGANLTAVQVPVIKDMEKLHNTIKIGVTR